LKEAVVCDVTCGAAIWDSSLARRLKLQELLRHSRNTSVMMDRNWPSSSLLRTTLKVGILHWLTLTVLVMV